MGPREKVKQLTRYGRSPWVDTFPKSRVPSYPRHRGAGDIDVVVVGGGLTGCLTAYAFAVHGAKIALLEAAQVGRGSAGSASGWIGSDPGVPFVDVERAVGLRAARRAFEAWHRAALDFAALLRRLKVRCGLEGRDLVTVATGDDDAVRLRREQKVRRDAGLDVASMTPRAILSETGLVAPVAARTRGGATVDPYRATVGLAAAAAARGAAIFERSPVLKIAFTRKDATVKTPDGQFRTRRVVVATGEPTTLHKGLRRHFWFNRSYFALTDPIPAKLRRQLGAPGLVLRDAAMPPHLLRRVGDDRLLVSGADLETPPERLRDRTIVQRTGQLMYELSLYYPDLSGLAPAYGWDAPYTRTETGLPYIGLHRNYPHQLFAFGDASRSLTGAYLASRIVLRQHLGEPDASDAVFAF